MNLAPVKTDVRLIPGNEACALAALDAGMRFFAGYPITPSSEIAEVLSVMLPKVGGVYIQMEDEIASAGAMCGAALTGVKAMTATSGPGFSLMQETIGWAAMAECPCVIVNVTRGGPSTGLPTLPSQGDLQQARWGTHGDHPVIALAPNSVAETYELTVRAFNLSERYRVPVIVLMDEAIGHVTEKMVMPDPKTLDIWERPVPDCPPERYVAFADTPSGVPPMAPVGAGYRYHVTGLYHDETGFPTNDHTKIDWLARRIHRKIDQARDLIVEVEMTNMEDAEVGMVAYGSAARACRHAMRLLRDEGLRTGLLRPRTMWPFPYKEIAACGVKKWLVVEMSLGQLAIEVERAVCERAPVARLGRVDGQLIHPLEVAERLREMLR
jgi:2-oxoglutarate ferredoxin oxidoreductase subunit alpha